MSGTESCVDEFMSEWGREKKKRSTLSKEMSKEAQAPAAAAAKRSLPR